jgi:hypothetical protein
MFTFWGFKVHRADSIAGRMERARNEGFPRGAREAHLFRLALRQDWQHQAAIDWINTAIEDGRIELEAQHALDREIDAWDMSARIMFMLLVGSS